MLFYASFLHNLKLSENRVGIKFHKYSLAVEQNKYLIKIVNVHIVHKLNDWPKNPTNNFKFNNCLFGATNVVISSYKEKYVGNGIACNSTGWWSFHNETAKNVVILVLIIVHQHMLTMAKLTF